MGFGLVDDSGSLPFLFLFIFHITQNKDIRTAFTGSQGNINLVGSNRRPAMCFGIGSFSFLYHNGGRRASVGAQERIPAGIKTVYRSVYGIKGIVVPALSVFCFVINGGTLYFQLAGA